jgi:hypothetical protein
VDQKARSKTSAVCKLALVVIGLSIASLSFCRRAEPQTQARVDAASVAKKNGWDHQSYAALLQITDRLEQEAFTAGDWTVLRSLIEKHPSLTLRMRASALLRELKGTPQEKEAVDVARKLVSNENAYLVSTGLLAMRRLDASDWRKVAIRLQSHASAMVREKAKVLLQAEP